ncbi:hypothetical protein ALC57_01928 [Trachymyrmex cornetzi]|uniref:GIY-YIG domain-containing protein n=1 Tax=Trachymyrmex cornetzi TaxID=471704 RepID=A0A195EK84_9HYME|nr:hypothetical protein ALC57_01928 [Trachymyrmex cornetzi]
MKARDMLNELLDGYGGSLTVLLAVLPFLKSGNIPRRVIQVVVGSVEAFPKDRITFAIINSVPRKLFKYPCCRYARVVSTPRPRRLCLCPLRNAKSDSEQRDSPIEERLPATRAARTKDHTQAGERRPARDISLRFHGLGVNQRSGGGVVGIDGPPPSRRARTTRRGVGRNAVAAAPAFSLSPLPLPALLLSLSLFPNLSPRLSSVSLCSRLPLSHGHRLSRSPLLLLPPVSVPRLSRTSEYKISYKSCDASYIGQTKRKLKTRLTEHRNLETLVVNNQSVITEHRIEFDHDFDWENVAILDEERFLNKRLISECLHILMQQNSLNLRSDTEDVHHTYIQLLKDFK